MSIGSITVDLLAKTGSFETDMARSAKTAEKRAKEIDAAVSKAGIAVGAALSTAAISAVYFGKQLIDGLDALNDYRDATGASIENLSALQDVAERTGANMDTVSGILVKFNSVLKEVDGKNAASQVLKQLGLDAEALKRMDPAEALRVTAVALSQFADDGNKARNVQELFGKSIKDAAPFLNDLATQTELVGKVTAEQTQAAEDFNKSLFALKANAADAGRALLNDLLPGMNAVLKALNQGGLRAGIDQLGNQLFDWEGNAQRGGIKNLKDEIASLAGTVERLPRTPGEIITVRPQDVETLARLRGELKQAEAAYYKLNAAAGGGRGSVNPPLVEGRPSLPSVSAVKEPKKAAGDSELQKYLEQLGKQLDKTKELSTAEQLLADVQAGRLKLQKGESLDAAKVLAKQVDEAKAMVEYKKLSVAADDARADALLKATLEQEKQKESLVEGNKATREEIELIGKSTDAQIAIEQARVSSLIAMKQEELARRESEGGYTRETDAIRAQIAALTERRDLVGQKVVAEKLKQDAEDAKQFAQQIGAAFESSFEKAILEGDKLSDVLKGLAKDVAALYIRNEITGPLAKAIGGGGSGGSGGFDLLGTIGKFFGGILKFADGGNPPVGKVSLVGEQGPELFVPRTAGTIVPNDALGAGGPNVTVHQYFTVGDVASMSEVRNAVAGSERRITAGISRSQRYGGALA